MKSEKLSARSLQHLSLLFGIIELLKKYILEQGRLPCQVSLLADFLYSHLRKKFFASLPTELVFSILSLTLEVE